MAGMSVKGIDFVMGGITDDKGILIADPDKGGFCLLYTSPSPRD